MKVGDLIIRLEELAVEYGSDAHVAIEVDVSRTPYEVREVTCIPNLKVKVNDEIVVSST